MKMKKYWYRLTNGTPGELGAFAAKCNWFTVHIYTTCELGPTNIYFLPKAQARKLKRFVKLYNELEHTSFKFKRH